MIAPIGYSLDFPFAQEPDPVGDVDCADEIMSYHEHRDFTLARGIEQSIEFQYGAWVQARGRFVEQQHGHVTRQGKCDGDLLTHTLGKAGQAFVPGCLGEAHRGKRGLDRIVSPLGLCEGKEVSDVLARGEMLVEGNILWHIGHLGTGGARVCHRIGPAHSHRAGARSEKAE